MARKGIIRETDFTHKEFCQMCAVIEKTFYNNFEGFAEKFHLETKRFKNNFEPSDDFFWALEWGELAAWLVRAYFSNPLRRKNTKEENITAGEILGYYTQRLAEVEELPDHIKDMAAALPNYLSTLKMVDKLPKLQQKIQELSAALIVTGLEQPGDAMDFIYQQLDEWIHNLHKNHYYIQLAKKSNQQHQIAQLKEMEQKAKDKEDKEFIQHLQQDVQNSPLQEEATGFDVNMAQLLKEMMKNTEYLNENPSQEDQLEARLKQMAPLLGLKVVEKHEKMNENELAEQRLIMYMIFSRMEWVIPKHQQKNAQAILEHYERNRYKLKSRQDKIDEKQQSGQELAEEEKNYLEFCQQLKDKAKEYKKASDLFLGQLLLPYLQRGK